jgi:DNA-binding NarL/FixJ family response regulator
MDSIARIHFPRVDARRTIDRRRTVLDETTKEAYALRSLSAREREVMILVVQGRTSKEIARVVGVKPTSIDTYRSRIMAKLDVDDLCALVRFAIRHGLVQP